MKTLLKTLIAALVVCSTVSCQQSTCGGDIPPKYRLVNQSNHTISIVPDPSRKDLSDSLVLLNGEEFNKGSLPYFRSGIIYYDGRYALNIDDIPLNRSFQRISLYREEPERLYIFTFIEEDYQFAVENGTDLGEKQ